MATAKEWKEIFEKMVAFDEEQIEFYSKEIEREGKYLKQYRAEDREHLEWVWGRGVLTKWEMECYGDKSYKGRDTKDAERRRNRAYRQRKYYRAKLEEHRKSLEEWEALEEEEAEREARRAEKEGAQEMKIRRNDYTSQEQFEQSGTAIEYNTVTVIKEDRGNHGKWMCMDIMTECKRPKTAIKRLFSVLTDDEIRGELNWRESDTLELVENGCFNLYEEGEFSFGCEENQEGLWYVWLNVCTEFPTEPLTVDPCDLIHEIKGELEDDAPIDIGYICDYDDSTYVSDAFAELADMLTSVYYSDIIKYISEHVEAVNDAIEEFGWDGCGSDLYKAGQMAEYLEINNWLWEHEEEAYQVYALNWYRFEYMEEVTKNTPIRIDTWERFCDELRNYGQCERIGDVVEIMKQTIEAMEESEAE